MVNSKIEIDRSPRREFMKRSAFGITALVAGGAAKSALGAPVEQLIERVATICRRLTPLGWRELLLEVTGGQLDLLASDLASELQKTLGQIDRQAPGFGDFTVHGKSAIEPGDPDRSLLYHAFAAPSVVANRDAVKLQGFPTLVEIETLENYIYASRKSTLEDLKAGAKPEDIGMADIARMQLHRLQSPQRHMRPVRIILPVSVMCRLVDLEVRVLISREVRNATRHSPAPRKLASRRRRTGLYLSHHRR